MALGIHILEFKSSSNIPICFTIENFIHQKETSSVLNWCCEMKHYLSIQANRRRRGYRYRQKL